MLVHPGEGDARITWRLLAIGACDLRIPGCHEYGLQIRPKGRRQPSVLGVRWPLGHEPSRPQFGADQLGGRHGEMAGVPTGEFLSHAHKAAVAVAQKIEQRDEGAAMMLDYGPHNLFDSGAAGMKAERGALGNLWLSAAVQPTGNQ